MASSYFSEPEQDLDPALFSGHELRPGIANVLLELLYGGLRDIGLRSPDDWVYAWLAGSGVSYQWSADRGNGDLDVLFGVDYPRFLATNPNFPRLSREEVAAYVDDLLKTSLWPKTANYSINGKHFEVTFFWNPGTGKNIGSIHPYAAWNLTASRWDVEPNPSPLYDVPDTWEHIADLDAQQAKTIEQMSHAGPSGAVHARSMARSLWREIHGGRRQAFSDLGHGYSDIHNFRWQAGKKNGIPDILKPILEDEEAHRPGGMDTPQDIITRAALRYSSPDYIGRGRG